MTRPVNASRKKNVMLEELLNQDSDDFFIKELYSTEDNVVMKAYYIKDGLRIYFGTFNIGEADRFVTLRNKLYSKYGMQQKPKLNKASMRGAVAHNGSAFVYYKS